MSTRSALTLFAVAAATLSILSACGDTAPKTPAVEEAEVSAPGSRSPSQQAFAEANDRMHAAMAEIPADADEAFMRGMLAHHRGAVEMAEVELKYGKDAQARDLAQRVITAQQAEIEEMEKWLADKGVSMEPATVDHAAMGH